MINQTVAKKMLQSLGMLCVVASDGREAVEAVRAAAVAPGGQYDVILMDMTMPQMGGVEATKVSTSLNSSKLEVFICGCILPKWRSIGTLCLKFARLTREGQSAAGMLQFGCDKLPIYPAKITNEEFAVTAIPEG